jgi:hypothetical protein
MSDERTYESTVCQALNDDELAQAVGGGDEPPSAPEPDLKATPILF